MNTNEPLDVDPQQNSDKHDDINDVPSMLGQMAFGLGLLALFGLGISQCTKKVIQDGYLGSHTQPKKELFHTLDSQKHDVTTIGF